MRRPTLRARAALPLVLALALAALPTPAGAAVRLLGVTPVRAGDQLACRLSLSGLPDERQLQSMRSGLIAAIELDLAVVAADGTVAAARSLTLRLGFDLWDEVFSVAGAVNERRFPTLEALRAWLAAPDALALAPWTLIDANGSYQLRVAMAAQPVARDERERVGHLIAGESRREPARQDRQEASVSLGRLIRFFYQGGRDEHEGLTAASEWFGRREVADEAH